MLPKKAVLVITCPTTRSLLQHITTTPSNKNRDLSLASLDKANSNLEH